MKNFNSKKSVAAFAILFSLLSFSHIGWTQSVEVDVKLTPAGDFVAKTTDVKGQAFLKENAVMAKNVVVDLKNLKTGIELRDKHTKKHLEVEKYPEVVLIKAVGKDGKGKGKIKLRGKEKIVEGTYKVSGDHKTLDASFPIQLSDFDITGINYMGVGVNDKVTVRIQLPLKELTSASKASDEK